MLRLGLLMFFLIPGMCLGDSIGIDLEKAIESDDSNSVIRLVDAGYHIIAKREYGEAALRYCASKGFMKQVRKLVESGADVNTKERDGKFKKYRPLHLALIYSQWDVVKYLIEKGADINHTIPYNMDDDVTPLFIAAENGNLEIVKLLVQKGAKINKKTYNRFSVLSCACQNAFPDITEYLLKNGARVSSKDKNRWTAVFYAVQGADIKSLKLLVEAGADVNKEDKNLMTPLTHSKVFLTQARKIDSRRAEQLLEIVNYLKKLGARE